MSKFLILFFVLFLLSLSQNSHSTEDSTEQNVEDEKKSDAHEADDMNMENQLDALLHAGEKNVHNKIPSSESEVDKSSFPDMADKLDSLLHNGEEHVHSGKHRSFAPNIHKTDNDVQFGTLDQEAVLHDGDAHIHSKEPIKQSTSNEQVIGAADLEHAMHDEKVHGNVPTNITESELETEGHNVDIELEALLHGGDGHVHEKKELPTTPSSVKFQAIDPEHLLHGGDTDPHLHQLEKEAADGSRPLSGPDPTVVPHEPQEVLATIGTMNEEDFLDYKKWKSEKNDSKSWLDGFSYLSEKLLFDFNSVRQRLFGKYNSTDDTVPHDEA